MLSDVGHYLMSPEFKKLLDESDYSELALIPENKPAEVSNSKKIEITKRNDDANISTPPPPSKAIKSIKNHKNTVERDTVSPNYDEDIESLKKWSHDEELKVLVANNTTSDKLKVSTSVQSPTTIQKPHIEHRSSAGSPLSPAVVQTSYMKSPPAFSGINDVYLHYIRIFEIV
jgi:hypothetical protein